MRSISLFAVVLFFVSCGGDDASTDESTEFYVDSTKTIDSLTYFERRLSKDPRNPTLKYERAKYYVKEGEIEFALADLRSVLSIDSNHIGANKLYADVTLSMLDLETSKYHYDKILSLDSSHAGSYLGLAKIYAALSNYGKADFYISESLKRDQYSPEPYFTRGIIYRSDWYQTGRKESFDIAVSSFQTAVEQEPDYYAAYVELGVMHAEIGDSIALEYYNSALDIYPESIEAWYNKGYYFQQRGEVDNALNCFWTLKDIDSTWFKPYYNIGYIHLIMTAEYDSAIYYFQETTRLDPMNSDAFNNLGLAWEEKGDKLNAKKYYQKAIEVDPDNKLAKENLRRVR